MNPSDDHTNQAGMTRRQMIGRTAAAGAIAWTAPALISSKAHAAGTLGGNVCADGRPEYLTYRYQPNGGWVWDVCDDGAGEMVDRRDPATLAPGDNPTFPCIILEVVGPNQTDVFTLANDGDEFTLNNIKPGNPDIDFYLYDCGQDPLNLDRNNAFAQLTVHVSCSQALCVGDTHGYFLVIDGGFV